MNTADHAMAETVRERLASTLRKLKNQGKVVADKDAGKNMRWGLAQGVVRRFGAWISR